MLPGRGCVVAFVNLVKLCVGIDTPAHLEAWQTLRRAEAEARGEVFFPTHVTRMWPRRAAEILTGGSLYWVIRGQILVRQPILHLEERIGTDGIARCAIVMEDRRIATDPAPRRAFQGWRYLAPEDAPRDLAPARTTDDTLPDHLRLALSEIGLQ